MTPRCFYLVKLSSTTSHFPRRGLGLSHFFELSFFFLSARGLHTKIDFTMTHLDLEIDENDPDLQDVWGRYSDMKAFHVLRHYLDGTEGFSILQTIKSLHDMLPDRTEDGTETQHSNFSHTVLDIAQQIPYSHPAQEHLARLLHELRRSTKLTDRVIDEEDVSHTTRGTHLSSLLTLNWDIELDILH